ncbi:MAG TPA: hypothetical protein VFJ01_06760 [Oleiagrimonas sp.]|nr:hypothetical protein [Oleiagrimonas sp.]
MSIRVFVRLGLPVLLPLLVAACAGSPLKGGRPGDDETTSLNHARQTLATAELCCTQFSQFDFGKALPSHPERFQINDKLPVADFGGSRSWFLAFHLPDDMDQPIDVLFKSRLSGRWLHHSYLFAPSVVVLDDAYVPLRIKDIQLCEYMGWTHATSGAFGHITIKDPAARYLVVYTSGNQLSSSTYWEQSPTAFSTTAPVQMASSGSFQIPHGPNGVIYVGKLTDRYRKSVDNAICQKPGTQGDGVLSTLRKAFLSDSRGAGHGLIAP